MANATKVSVEILPNTRAANSSPPRRSANTGAGPGTSDNSPPSPISETGVMVGVGPSTSARRVRPSAFTCDRCRGNAEAWPAVHSRDSPRPGFCPF